MTENPNTIRSIAWIEIFPWLKLAKCPRFALSAGLIVIAMLGLLATSIGWQCLTSLYGTPDDAQLVTTMNERSTWPWQWGANETFASLMRKASNDPNFNPRLPDPFNQPFVYAKKMMGPFRDLFDPTISLKHFFYSLLCAIWAILVWSIFGAALTRSAALFLTREEKISPFKAIQFGFRRWTNYIGGPVLPVVCCLLLAIPLATLGLIARSDFGAGIVAFAWPIVLVCGFLMAILLVGLTFGWLLMWPTISVEGSESWDAMSRAYSYTYHRPGKFFFYVIVAVIMGGFAIYLVELIAEVLIQLSLWGISWGSGGNRMMQLTALAPDAENHNKTARWFITFWTNFVWLAVFGYVVSYFWTAATSIYLLLRKDEDGAEVEEIFIEPEGDAFGLPPLKKDAAGVPVVDNDSTLPKSGP